MRLPESLCQICHAIFGFLTVQAVLVHPVLVGIFFLTFVLYEMDEEWNIGDHAFEEMREYGVGLGVGLCALIVLSML